MSKNVEKKLRENRSCGHWDPLAKVWLNVRHITCVFYSWFNFEAYIQNTTNPEKGCEFHNPPKSKVQKSRQTSCFSEFYERKARHFFIFEKTETSKLKSIIKRSRYKITTSKSFKDIKKMPFLKINSHQVCRLLTKWMALSICRHF